MFIHLTTCMVSPGHDEDVSSVFWRCLNRLPFDQPASALSRSFSSLNDSSLCSSNSIWMFCWRLFAQLVNFKCQHHDRLQFINKFLMPIQLSSHCS